MHEFELIELIQNMQADYIAKQSNYVNYGIGDDCASLSIPATHELLISTDTLVEGVHFDGSLLAEEVGHKALAVSLSDIASMAAKPIVATLNLTLPAIDRSWLNNFLQGFFALAQKHNLVLVGGDTTKGPLSITVTLHGIAPQGEAVKRSGAQVGDRIYVSGALGEAACVLKYNAKDRLPLHKPEPHCQLGLALQGVANAMIDVSDGLSSDLGHILKASDKGAQLQAAQIPIGKQLQTILSQQEALMLALHGGEDYALCFTVSANKQNVVNNIKQNFPAVTEIGVITKTTDFILQQHGQSHVIEAKGYNHFTHE